MQLLGQETRDQLSHKVLLTSAVHLGERRIDRADGLPRHISDADPAGRPREALLPLLTQRLGLDTIADVTRHRVDLRYGTRLAIAMLADAALDQHHVARLVHQPVADRRQVRAVENLRMELLKVRNVIGMEELVGRASDDLLRGVAEDPLARRRRVQARPVRREARNHVGRLLGQHPELPLAQRQRLLSAAGVGDVAGDRHRADHHARLVAHGRELGHVMGLAVGRRHLGGGLIAGQRAFVVRQVARVALGGQDVGKRAAHHRRGREPALGKRRAAGKRDPELCIDHDDRRTWQRGQDREG